MQLQRYLNHSQIDVVFKQSKDDFVVNEVPLYDFTGEGEHLVLKLRKKDLATWDAIEILANYLKCSPREFGYAGLKDKNAMTVQHISVHRKFEEALKEFSHENIKILETTYHNNKIKIGHLKGNNFFIRLKRVGLVEKQKIEEAMGQIATFGMPNYFGFQRFGKEVEENLEKAKQLLFDDYKVKDKKVAKMLISAYQSTYFNAWLVERLKLNKSEFKLLNGDIFYDIESSKLFTPKAINEKIINDFKDKKITPTGLLPGNDVFKARDEALKIEQKYDNSDIREKGYRREAIVFPEILSTKYNKEKKEALLDFILPKGSYATVLIEALANRNFG